MTHGKTSSNRSNCGRTFELTDKDRHALKRIVGRKHRTNAAKVTAELNQHLNSQVSNMPVRREINKAGSHGRAAIRKPVFRYQHLEEVDQITRFVLQANGSK